MHYPPGAVRTNFSAVVDQVRRNSGAKPLTDHQRQKLQEAADDVFGRPNAGRSSGVWDAFTLLVRWRAIL